MITYDDAPNYRYRGYRYVPQIMHEDEEGIRKASHFVFKVENYNPNGSGIALPDFSINASPYRWLTYDEFKHHIDNLGENDD